MGKLFLFERIMKHEQHNGHLPLSKRIQQTYPSTHNYFQQLQSWNQSLISPP
jgi:hypothetical protein